MFEQRQEAVALRRADAGMALVQFPAVRINHQATGMTELDVGMRLHIGDLPRQFFGPPQVIGIQKRQEFALGQPHGLVAGHGREPAVLRAPDQAEARILEGRDAVGAAVGGGVVHHERFEPAIGLGEHAADAGFDMRGLVVNPDDYADQWLAHPGRTLAAPPRPCKG